MVILYTVGSLYKCTEVCNAKCSSVCIAASVHSRGHNNPRFFLRAQETSFHCCRSSSAPVKTYSAGFLLSRKWGCALNIALIVGGTDGKLWMIVLGHRKWSILIINWVIAGWGSLSATSIGASTIDTKTTRTIGVRDNRVYLIEIYLMDRKSSHSEPKDGGSTLCQFGLPVPGNCGPPFALITKRLRRNFFG